MKQMQTEIEGVYQEDGAAVRTGGERAGRFGPGHAGAGGIFLPQR